MLGALMSETSAHRGKATVQALPQMPASQYPHGYTWPTQHNVPEAKMERYSNLSRAVGGLKRQQVGAEHAMACRAPDQHIIRPWGRGTM